MDYAKESLKKHAEWKSKLEITARAHVTNSEELSLAYTPGVAQPCLAIKDDYQKSFELTRRGNMVAVITDGSAVPSQAGRISGVSPADLSVLMIWLETARLKQEGKKRSKSRRSFGADDLVGNR